MIKKFFSLPKKIKVNYSLLGGAFVLFLVYQLSISETLVAWGKNKNYKEATNRHLTSEDITSKKEHLTVINKRLKSKAQNKEELRKTLLSYISELSTELKLNLVSLPEMSTKEETGFITYINKVDLEGNYENQVKILNEIEQHADFGQVVSVEFNKVRNKVTKRDQLIMSLYIQSIIFI